MSPAFRNVVVVGGSYVGLNAARELMSILPHTHRVLLIEPHTHFNHIFTFPRFAILNGHEHKAFVPYTGVFSPSSQHRHVVAKATKVHPNHIEIDSKWEGSYNIPFEHLVLATGTNLSAPSMMPHNDSLASTNYLQSYQTHLRNSQAVTIIGGGAVGVQMALDLKELYPKKQVTVIHSRDRLMQNFHPKLHEMIRDAFAEKGIALITNTRAKLPASEAFPNDGRSFDVEVTTSQQPIPSDFVILATGQKPNNQLISSLVSSSPEGLVNPANGFLRVRKTLQLQDPAYPHIFAVGDIADTGLHKAARPGAAQAKIVAKNVLQMIEGEKPDGEFEKSPRAIHLSLGLKRNIIFRNPNEEEGQTDPMIIDKFDGREDMNVEGMWERLNIPYQQYLQQQRLNDSATQWQDAEIRAEL